MSKEKIIDPTDIHVGRRIRARRMAVEMSQEKLGIALGVTFQQIQKYEKGTNRVSASRLQQTGRVLGVPVKHFFEGLDDAPADTSGQVPSVSAAVDFIDMPDSREILRLWPEICANGHSKTVLAVMRIAAGEAA